MVTPVASLSRSAWVTLPNSRARYLRTQPADGISSRRAISPSLVRSSKPFGIEIQPSHRHDAAQRFGQVGEDGGPAFFILVGGDQARWACDSATAAPARARPSGLPSTWMTLFSVTLSGGGGDDFAVQHAPGLRRSAFRRRGASRCPPGLSLLLCVRLPGLSSLSRVFGHNGLHE